MRDRVWRRPPRRSAPSAPEYRIAVQRAVRRIVDVGPRPGRIDRAEHREVLACAIAPVIVIARRAPRRDCPTGAGNAPAQRSLKYKLVYV